MGYRLAAVCAALAVLALAPPALADSSLSTNWAGYVAQQPGGSFRSVSATWIQPGVVCQPGSPSFSSFWVGLGGYSGGAPALEQIGTEMDCGRSGRPLPSAWYETVPAPSYAIYHPVQVGDLMSAGVTVIGHQVTLSLIDSTRGWVVRKVLHIVSIDVSSAEWIVEAPSECSGSCITLPLAAFGSAAFSSATATTTTGHTGGLTDPAWRLTRVLLRPTGRRAGALGGGATPSPVAPGGRSFTVSYSQFTLAPRGSARELLAHAAG